MNKKINNLIHSKLFIIILILLLACSTIFVGTYAWFTWESNENTTFVMTIGNDIADVVFENGNDINSKLPVVYNYNEGVSTSFSIINKAPSDKVISYVVKFNINSIADGLKSEDVKYALVKDNVLVSEGNFSNASNGVSISLFTDILSTGTSSYVLYLYIDGNVENDSNMMGKSIVGNIVVFSTEENTLVDIINDLYNNADKTVVTVNDIEYNYATSVSLMNDRLGGVTSDYDAGNIRYYGANPNNYIYFNCSDYSNQTSDTCELWRIIGVFDGKVKIIRDESIGNLAWDYDKNINDTLGTYSNDWHNSTLQMLLNNKYFYGDKFGTIRYYAISTIIGGAVTYSDINLNSIGIKNDTTRNMIINSIWNLGGISLLDNTMYGDYFYNQERDAQKCDDCNYDTIWNGKIALIYLSDYTYAIDFESDYINNEVCHDNNWISSGENNKTQSYTISPSINSSQNVLSYVNSCQVVEKKTTLIGFNGPNVKPSLFLNPNLIFKLSGGTKEDPYKIIVE